MEYLKNCIRCGGQFKDTRGTRKLCYSCTKERIKEMRIEGADAGINSTTVSASRLYDIAGAKELLTALGYDVTKDIHDQWRWKHRNEL